MYERVSASDNAPSAGGRSDSAELVHKVVELLGCGRAGLVTDVDGTISPIVGRPEEAIVLDSAKMALKGLKEMVSVVAVVSGRAAADARNMLGIDGLTYIGNHGLEIWSADGPQVVPEARPWLPRLAAVLDDVARQLEQRAASHTTPEADDPEAQKASDDDDAEYAIEPGGVIIENKGATASLHYRLAKDPDATRRELLHILARCAVTSGLRIEEGRRVINLLPPLTVTKGSAVSWLVREHRLDRLVYLGDDVTDAHAFKALKMMREAVPPVQTLGIGVIGSDTPPIVRQLADTSVPSVEAVSELLREVLDGLKSSARMEARAPSVGST